MTEGEFFPSQKNGTLCRRSEAKSANAVSAIRSATRTSLTPRLQARMKKGTEKTRMPSSELSLRWEAK